MSPTWSFNMMTWPSPVAVAPPSPTVVVGVVDSGMLICTTLVSVDAVSAVDVVVLEALAPSSPSPEELHPTASTRATPTSAANLCIPEGLDDLERTFKHFVRRKVRAG